MSGFEKSHVTTYRSDDCPCTVELDGQRAVTIADKFQIEGCELHLDEFQAMILRDMLCDALGTPTTEG